MARDLATGWRCDVLLITFRRLSDDDHGAGVRTARLAEVLASRYRVTVVEPRGPAPAGETPPWHVIHFDPRSLSLQHALDPASTEGASIWASVEAALPDMTATAAPVVVWADAVLASAGLGRVLPDSIHIVEFANIESRRYLAMALDGSLRRRSFSLWEAAKAVLWQRTVARRADAVIALARSDARSLRTRRPKLLVRNGIEPAARPPQPSSGTTLLAVGSWWYGPNRQGMRRFLRDEWPAVLSSVPSARLTIVGSGGAELVDPTPRGVEIAGFVDDLEAVYEDAALVLAPARSGGGSQLKLVGALARGRIVVGPRFLARERTPEIPDGALQADDRTAAVIVGLLEDPEGRHAIEERIVDAAARSTWARTAEPLFRFIDLAITR